MKLIKAYIRPEKLEDVYSALNHENICCMTVSKGRGPADILTLKRNTALWIFLRFTRKW